MREEAIQGYAIPKTLSQIIYNHLKQSIITNKIKAGQKINERKIADLFEVSITPVREAVFMLGAEGLVNIKSHKEVVVKELSHEEIKEIFQVLSILESYAVTLAVDRIGDEDLKVIEDLQKEMEVYCQEDSIERYCVLNMAIHNKLWELVPNKFLRQTLHNVHNQLLRYNYAQVYALGKRGALKKSLKEHQEILKALKARNKRQLKTFLAKHWGSFLRPSLFEEGLKEYLNVEQKGVIK